MENKQSPNQFKAADSLSAQEELDQYLALFKAVPDIIYKINADGYFLYVSEAVTELGYAPAELIGKHFKDIIHPDDVNTISREAVLPLYKGKNTGDQSAPKLFDERRTGNRGTRRLVVRFVPKFLKDHVQTLIAEDDDRQFYGEVHSYGDYFNRLLHRMQNASGPGLDGVLYGEVSASGQYFQRNATMPEKFVGSVGIIRNITDTVLLGKQKAHLEEQLHHSLKVEAIGQMTVGVIHDLNNVMNNCLCSAELISEKLSAMADVSMRQIIGAMVGEITKGAELIRTLLDFSRKTQIKSAVLNGHALINDVVHLLEFTFDGDIEINRDFHAENPYVAGDAGQLQNVLVNLALNARDAMDHGGKLTFSTENRFLSAPLSLPACQQSAPGEYLVIAVSDNGCGMDAKTIQRLFEPFFTTKPPGKGTGLGLANVARVMKNHQGFVDVDSSPGKGATFRLFAPTTVVNAAAPVDGNTEQSLKVVPIFVKARVLVIDNDAAVCEILSLTLKNAGCRVDSNTNPLSAVEAYRKHWEDFDVVLIDMLMPHCNGFECFRRLKKINPSIKALLVSGLNELIEEKRIAETGFAGSITKPFNVRELITAVDRLSRAP